MVSAQTPLSICRWVVCVCSPAVHALSSAARRARPTGSFWQGVREHRGLVWIGAGIAALAAHGFVATSQHDPHFGRVVAAYGGIFVAGSLAWGTALDDFRPDRYDATGALICLVGVAVIMYAPRPACSPVFEE